MPMVGEKLCPKLPSALYGVPVKKFCGSVYGVPPPQDCLASHNLLAPHISRDTTIP